MNGRAAPEKMLTTSEPVEWNSTLQVIQESARL